jgi:HK97 family phage portal protein
MGIVSRILGKLGGVRAAVDPAKERRLWASQPGGWAGFGKASVAGKTVNLETTLQLSAAWACIKVTAQAVSSLPLQLFDKIDNGNRVQVAPDDDLAQLLDSPNADQTSLEYWESTVAWLLASGNSYSEIVEGGARRRIVALQPLASSDMWPKRNADGELEYHFRDRGKVEILPRSKVFHIKGFGQHLRAPDAGLSPIAAGVHSLGAAMASQGAAAGTFANGMRPTGFFLFDQLLSPEQREQAKATLIDPLSGSERAGGVGILEGGVKWQTVSLDPEAAQMLETRRFDIEEICRWFGVPPILIGHAGQGQTMWGTGVEQILIAWLTLGVDPICDRIESRIKKQLIRPYSGPRRYAEFLREALLQMDSKAKADFLSKCVQNGLMTRNEGRSKLNLPRVAGGDELTAQTNLAPLDELGGGGPLNSLRAALQAVIQSEDDKGVDHV